MMNNHPRLEVDEAIVRRMHLIPFLQRWTSKIGEKAAKGEVHQADEGLKNRLRDEAPGFLRWGIEGAKKWFTKGLMPPKVVAEYTVNFFDNADPYETWLTECGHELNVDYFTPTTALWEDWLEYCKRTRQRAGSSINTFSEELAKRDHLFEPGKPKRKGHKQVRGFFGVKMKKSVHNIERSYKVNKNPYAKEVSEAA
jgi:putative DNA primase/helicase